MSDGPATTELLAAAKDAAARDTDYYALLDLAPTDPLTRDSVQRAWRKRSLRYHPDKAGAAFDAAKWEEFGLARDVLASDEARAAYDAARDARLRKQRERDLMNAKQRRFAEELERAEGSASRRARGEQEGGRGAEEEEERARQAAEGRRYMEERKRKVREAEERERERERKEDEERDDRIRELEGQIADKARRRAEKRAKREARKSGGAGLAVADEEDVAKTTTTTTTTAKPTTPEAKPTTTDEQQHKKATPIPAAAVPVAEVKMSDDPIQFWESQWPKTKARLRAAQATKESRLAKTRATA